jgi:molybdate-binding protein/DNA-binding transcriptional regulator YhcF (GntR family)
MTPSPLFHEIAESIRQAIYYGKLKEDDELPPVRDMAEQWGCAPGTVQRAYQELAQQGLVVSRPGQGTRVAGPAPSDDSTPLRRAALVNKTERFLLEVLAAGHTSDEADQAFRLALDRWRAVAAQPSPQPAEPLRFVGSHDPAIALIATRLGELAPGYALHVSFAGSLGGLIALAEHRAEIAGSHLWDEDSGSYNRPFVRRLLPGRRVALLTLAQRRLGLIVPPGNPAAIVDLPDLTRPGVRFINRQSGAGTRVWLDTRLHRLGIAPEQVAGYGDQRAATHAEIARAVAAGEADVGLGIEAAALAFGLDFVCLTTERYDLVIPAEVWASQPVQRLAEWLASDEARAAIEAIGGYDTRSTGRVEWVD